MFKNILKWDRRKKKSLITGSIWEFIITLKIGSGKVGKLGCINEVVKSGHFVNDNGFNLSTINGLHSEIKTNLKKRRGVAIKHLQGYLDMFLFKKMLNYTVENQDKNIFTYNKSIPNQTRQYIKDIFEKALPIDLYEAYKEYNYGIFKK